MGRLAQYFVPQPVEDCLEVLGGALLAGNAAGPVLASASESLQGWDAGGDDGVRCLFWLLRSCTSLPDLP